MRQKEVRLINRSRREQVIQELNGNSKSLSVRSVVFSLSGMFIVTVALAAVKYFEEWIDSKGEIVMIPLCLIGLACFAYWALVGRKK